MSQRVANGSGKATAVRLRSNISNTGSIWIAGRIFDRLTKPRHDWVLSDPEEKHELGLAACGELPLLADKQHGGPPSVIR
jgi:hypothetical protein